jgi:excisionase family DNA binding protein
MVADPPPAAQRKPASPPPAILWLVSAGRRLSSIGMEFPGEAVATAKTPVPELMNTREVAAYLRIKERTVYELVRRGEIPCSRLGGKWLFPRSLIDDWLKRHTGGAMPDVAAEPPPVVAGSHDPLLEWALRECGSALALMTAGSLDGLERLAGGQAALAGLHVLDPDSGEFNVPLIRRRLAGRPVVAIEWARRQQGLVVATGNPLGIVELADLARGRARVVERQDEAGSRVLFRHLLGRAGVDVERLDVLPRRARSETDVADTVREGKADAGFAIAAAARSSGLEFVPLARERFDLVMMRRTYFEPPVQVLLDFTRSAAFAARAGELAGYDVRGLGRVVYNGP